MKKSEIKRRIIAALKATENLGAIPTGVMCNYFSPHVSGDVSYLFSSACQLRKSCVSAKMIGKKRFKKLSI